MPEPDRVAPRAAMTLVQQDGYRLIDVRSEPEFQQGHPSGAFNVPLRHVAPEGMGDNPDFLEVMRANFAPDVPLVLACRSGNRSLTAARLLLQAGYQRVVDQRAGFSGTSDPFGGKGEAGWVDLGLPVSLQAEPGRDYASLAGTAGVSVGIDEQA